MCEDVTILHRVNEYEFLGVCMCRVVMFLVSLHHHMGCIAVQIVDGFGMKKRESLKLNIYVPQNAAPLNVTTCSHTFENWVIQPSGLRFQLFRPARRRPEIESRVNICKVII